MVSYNCKLIQGIVEGRLRAKNILVRLTRVLFSYNFFGKNLNLKLFLVVYFIKRHAFRVTEENTKLLSKGLTI